MLLFYKGKGLLVPLFLLISIFGSAFLTGSIKRNFEPLEHIEISYKYVVGIGFILAGIWTWYAKDTYIKHDGKKIILEEEINSFFFIKLKYWAHIFYLIGLIFFVDQLLLS